MTGNFARSSFVSTASCNGINNVIVPSNKRTDVPMNKNQSFSKGERDVVT